jgi:hypothetical protein
VEADRVFAALQRHVLEPGQAIEDRRYWPDIIGFYAGRFGYEARPADWRIADEVWVEAAVRVVADGHAKGFVITYGLLFERGGRVHYLNDLATMRALGRRLGEDLDPLAYAELLGELYSGSQVDQPTVMPFSATELHRAGALIRDVDAFVAEYPFADASLVSPPAIRRSAGEVAVDFLSYHYYLTETSGAIDILKWTVVGGGGREASWSRRYVAERLERTY